MHEVGPNKGCTFPCNFEPPLDHKGRGRGALDGQVLASGPMWDSGHCVHCAHEKARGFVRELTRDIARRGAPLRAGISQLHTFDIAHVSKNRCCWLRGQRCARFLLS